MNLDRCYQVVQKPVITEKASDDTARRNGYAFRVPRDANKVEIREAIESLFKVHVLKVNTLRVKSKDKRRGYAVGQTQEWKKAMVVLREGETIDVL